LASAGIPRTLSASSFDTLFTVAPAVLPYSSAAALRLSLGENDYDWQEIPDKTKLEEKPEDPRAVMLAALRNRATTMRGR